MIENYLAFKAFLSNINDGFVGWGMRAGFIEERTPKEAAELLWSRGEVLPDGRQYPTPYTGDPVGGAIDFYTNPLRLERALRISKEEVKKLRIDCDDIAIWSAVTTRKSRVVDFSIVVTLVDQGLVGSHVVCIGRYKNGDYFRLDTAGLANIPYNEFIYNSDPKAFVEINQGKICKIWEELYAERGFKYIDAVYTPDPFKV